MVSDLVVMLFEQPGEAQGVYDVLHSLRRSPILGLENALVVTRNSESTPHAPAAPGTLDRLAGPLFMPDLASRRAALAGLGLEARFAGRLAAAAEGSQSALLALLDYDDIADKDELLQLLALFRGQLLQTTLTRSAARPETNREQ